MSSNLPQSHPGQPTKREFTSCPSCHGPHPLIENTRGKYCPECNWKNYEVMSVEIVAAERPIDEHDHPSHRVATTQPPTMTVDVPVTKLVVTAYEETTLEPRKLPRPQPESTMFVMGDSIEMEVAAAVLESTPDPSFKEPSTLQEYVEYTKLLREHVQDLSKSINSRRRTMIRMEEMIHEERIKVESLEKTLDEQGCQLTAADKTVECLSTENSNLKLLNSRIMHVLKKSMELLRQHTPPSWNEQLMYLVEAALIYLSEQQCKPPAASHSKPCVPST